MTFSTTDLSSKCGKICRKLRIWSYLLGKSLMEGFFYCALYAIAIYNPGKNIWHKVKIYNKIGQDFKNMMSNFACFLTAIVNV